MPLYECQCRDCGKIFELLRRMSEADQNLECPGCHSAQIERQFSTFAASACGISSSRGFT